MQIERRISSLLEYYAEMQLILSKDNANRVQNIKFHLNIVLTNAQRLVLTQKLSPPYSHSNKKAGRLLCRPAFFNIFT